jgi:hypothetical protein
MSVDEIQRSIMSVGEIQIQALKRITKPTNRAPSPPALFAGGEGGEAG